MMIHDELRQRVTPAADHVTLGASAITQLSRDLLIAPSAVPRYHRLAQSIRALIAGGGFQQWEQLPAEQDVADYFHISRPTVRQAWQELQGQHLIIRDHGRGTFIGNPIEPTGRRHHPVTADQTPTTTHRRIS